MGYLLKTLEGGAKVEMEADTLSCSHCQRVITVPDWKKEGAWCWKCGHALCLRCHGRNAKEGCVPFMKQVEQAIERQKLWRKV